MSCDAQAVNCPTQGATSTPLRNTGAKSSRLRIGMDSRFSSTNHMTVSEGRDFSVAPFPHLERKAVLSTIPGTAERTKEVMNPFVNVKPHARPCSGIIRLPLPAPTYGAWQV